MKRVGVMFPVVAESLCRHAGVCVCQHFPGGAADSHHPGVPAEGCREETRSHAAGQQPGRQGNRHWSAQVGPNGTVGLNCKYPQNLNVLMG